VAQERDRSPRRQRAPIGVTTTKALVNRVIILIRLSYSSSKRLRYNVMIILFLVVCGSFSVAFTSGW
jgi:hypothetical protein